MTVTGSSSLLPLANYLKLMRVVLKYVPLERWIQLMIGGFKTVNLAWVNKIAVIGYTWLFVYESAGRYERRMNAALGVHGIIRSWCEHFTFACVVNLLDEHKQGGRGGRNVTV